MKEDIIEGFNNGADDYITKPFNTEELLVRIQAVMRRANLKKTGLTNFRWACTTSMLKTKPLNLKASTKNLLPKKLSC